MPGTKRLYYTDSYLTQTDALVTAASDDHCRLTLDQTVFYPSSGGQPHDLGSLNGIPVIDVIDEGESITHLMAAPLTESAVQAEILWPRRYDHMQQHTGQHLLSAVFEEQFKIPTLSFHMGSESSNIELGVAELTEKQIETAVLRATELARANARIVITFEDAASAQGLRKASERSGTLRIVEIPELDRSACGGTHVGSLAEVLPLQIRDSEKVRGHVRVSFVCGNRAVKRGQADFHALAQIAKKLATPLDTVETQVAALQQRLIETEKHNQRLETAAATRAGLDLYAATAPGADGIRRSWLSVAAIDESARTHAKAFVSQVKALLLVSSGDGLLLASSADSGINAGAIVKAAAAKFQVRGGGSATLAQGSLTGDAMLADLKVTLGLDALGSGTKAG